MGTVLLRSLLLSFAVASASVVTSSEVHALTPTVETPDDLAGAFETEVQQRLAPPADEAMRYGQLLNDSLSQAQLRINDAQIVVLVDRNPKLQALFIFFIDATSNPKLIGTAPVSTGRIGTFDYFETPVGVFDHSINNLDFRAEGTKNEFGIRGYGVRGMRIYDFGWQQARKGWGDRSISTMRLQMHATDPALLEPKLGTVQSKGCIRISASLNRFIDHYGLLDADYESAIWRGSSFWVLSPNRSPTPWSGRYLVVVDTERSVRPAWSLPPPITLYALTAQKTNRRLTGHSVRATKVAAAALGCTNR